MESVNEQSTCIVTASFKDENGSPVTPGTASYSLYCQTTGQEILSDTPLAGLAASKDIEVTPAQNSIQNAGNPEEIKLLTIKFTYSGGAKQGTAQYQYKVINLQRIS